MNDEQDERQADWDGEQYRAVNSLQQWSAHRSLRAVHLDGDERLLDIGCGDGKVTAELAHRLPHGSVVGIDPSPRMIEAAQQLATGNLAFRLVAAETVGADGEFDAVVSFNALHWVADQAGALAAIVRALRPGGWGLVLLVCAGPRCSVEQVAMDVAGTPAFAAFFTEFTAPFHHAEPAVFEEDVRRAGARVVAASADELEWEFASAAEFHNWLRAGFSDWTARLPDESARTAFIEATAAAYAADVGSDRLFRFQQLTVRFDKP